MARVRQHKKRAKRQAAMVGLAFARPVRRHVFPLGPPEYVCTCMYMYMYYAISGERSEATRERVMKRREGVSWLVPFVAHNLSEREGEK